MRVGLFLLFNISCGFIIGNNIIFSRSVGVSLSKENDEIKRAAVSKGWIVAFNNKLPKCEKCKEIIDTVRVIHGMMPRRNRTTDVAWDVIFGLDNKNWTKFK